MIFLFLFIYRHDYDEFSRQEPRVVSDSSDSENSSPGGGNNSPIGNSPSQKMSPSQMSVSPAEGYLSAQSPSAFRLLSRETVSQVLKYKYSKTYL